MLSHALLSLCLMPIATLHAPEPALQGAPPAAASAQTAPAAPTTPLPRRPGPLGVRLSAESTDRALVETVLPGTPAALAGIRAGDTIVSVAGKPVGEIAKLREATRGLSGGQTIPVEVLRDGATVRVQVTLADLREEVEGSTVTYSSVAHPDGYRLRTIITEPVESPRAKDGKLPAILYVQGIVCDSIDRPGIPDAVDTRLVHAMAKAGFVTMRVDKPGLGDSEGPPCSEIDLTTELEGCKAALKQLASLPGVDPNRVYLFGHSMGGVLAPYLSADTPVRGTIVYGTLVRSWFEYQLENVRRQSELAGLSPAQVTANVQAEARSSAMILVEKKTLGDVWNRWPELRQEPQGIMYDENHMSTRHMRFFHELQDLNIADAWTKSTGAVLALWGEYDWVCSRDDHERIAAIVNARTEGAGSVLTMPKADHAFTTHGTLLASRMAMGEGTWDEELPKRMLEWIDALESGTRAAWQEPVLTQAEIDAAVQETLDKLESESGLPAWTKLATEAYPGKQDDIFFVNPELGFYGNGAGKIFRTTDGGATWTKVFEQKGTFVRCLAFTDEKHGVMGNIGPGYFPGVTDTTPVYRTEDGGTTWTPVAAIEGAPVVGLCAFDIVQVPFVNSGNLDHKPRIIGVGRVGGPAAYIWSDDLGKSWKQGKIPEIGTMAFDVKFLDDQRGFIASATHADVSQSNGLILATDDGGSTWREVYRSSRPFEITWKFSFPTDETGYCTLQSYDPDPAKEDRFVVKTNDGGKTWFEVPLVSDHAVRPFGIAFVDEDRGWIGAMPNGFKTVDGGLSWTPAEFGNAVNKIRIVPSGAGFVAYAIGVEVHKARAGAASDTRPADEQGAAR
ncbi:MAG: alpha/beta fold hydrolase [bacterium]